MNRAPTLALVLSLASLAACGADSPPPQPPPTIQPKPTPAGTTGREAKPADPLPSRPPLGDEAPFTPPSPTVFKLKTGTTVWLLERHTLPIVSVTLTIPRGSALDPADKPGLAYITGDMLDEGAGKRSALEVSSALQDLGASVSTSVGADGTAVSLGVLRKNFDAAAAIYGDVITKPRFEDKEWKRVSDLWKNALAKRADDPAAVARVVSSALLYGAGTPYGHPSDGLPSGAAAIGLKDVKAFYESAYRPEDATLVVVGDMTRDAVEKSFEAVFAAWKGKGAAPVAPAVDALKVSDARPRLVIVDRPDAPQSVASVVRDGVRVNDPVAPRLDLINTALGGSFTSRLNQNLREEKGWTYGIRSGFTETRGQGAFTVRASIDLPHTGEALAEMLREMRDIASKGLTADELGKVRAQDRADLVQTYETVESASRRLGTLATLGLGPNFDAEATKARQSATLDDLKPLGAKHVDPVKATILLVGPEKDLLPQLAKLDLGTPERRDAEGKPITGAAPTNAAGKKPATKKP